MKKILIALLFCCSVLMVQAKPILSFFNELEGPELKTFFSDTSIIPTLQKLHAEIRMGMIDLSPERAQVLKDLNKAGVPVVAWLLLPKSEGYWFNAMNGDLAIARYHQIKKWADSFGIHFKGIGLDLELDYRDAQLIKSDPWKLASKIPARLYQTWVIDSGRATYHKLLNDIKKDGYPAESYIIGFVKDETQNGTTSIQQASRFLDIPMDKEIQMLYTSFMGNPDGFLKIYGLDKKAKYIALGSTGGGVDTTLPSLSYENLIHDIRMVSPIADEIHIFSLEGTVHHGYLKRLLNLDYSVPIPIREDQVEAVKKIQSRVIMVSNILAHPTLLFLGILSSLFFLFWLLYLVVRFIFRILSRSQNSRNS